MVKFILRLYNEIYERITDQKEGITQKKMNNLDSGMQKTEPVITDSVCNSQLICMICPIIYESSLFNSLSIPVVLFDEY